MPEANRGRASRSARRTQPAKRTSLTFVHYEDVAKCDVLFLSFPNGAHRRARVRGPSEDRDRSFERHRFATRRRTTTVMALHTRAERSRAVDLRIPELHRTISAVRRASPAPVQRDASILAVLPLFRPAWSTAAGLSSSSASRLERRRARAERDSPPSGAFRRGAIVSGRRASHTAEIEQELRLGDESVRVTVGHLGRACARRARDGARLHESTLDEKALGDLSRLLQPRAVRSNRQGAHRHLALPGAKLLAGRTSRTSASRSTRARIASSRSARSTIS